MYAGKGQWLARQILALQRKRNYLGISGLPGDVNTSGYFSGEESDDSSRFSLDGSAVFTLDDMESDGKFSLQL